MENGRRYAILRGEGEFRCPSDDKSFKVFDLTHVIWVVLMYSKLNELFESFVGENTHNVVHIVTADGSRAKDVGDTFPNVSSTIQQGAHVLMFGACCS